MSEPTFNYPWLSGQREEARALLLLRSGGGCELCGSQRTLAVHHDRYPATVTLADLRLLCGSCHRKVHALHGSPRVPRNRRKQRSRFTAWEQVPAEMTVAFAARVVNVPATALAAAVQAGQLPLTEVGNYRVITRDSLRAFFGESNP